MGGRFSRVQFREQDAAVLAPFVALTRSWCGNERLATLAAEFRTD